MTDPLIPLLADVGAVTARLDGLVDRTGGPSACWPWTGGSLVGGYPTTWVRLTNGRGRNVKVHRLVAELVNGEVDETVDHTCHDHRTCAGGQTCPHRRCLNPAHLAAESLAQNIRRAHKGKRRETCGKGHPLITTAGGVRKCRACQAARARARRAANPTRRGPARPQQDRTTGGTIRQYRPRGLSEAQLVDWGLEGQQGDGCWLWRGQTAGGNGYVTLHLIRDGQKVAVDAHRLVYEVRTGPIPQGAHVDHTCHRPENCPGGGTCPHRACCNPSHLVATTPARNAATDRRARRPDTCKNGHDLADAYVDKTGRRHCRRCAAERALAAHHAAREGKVDGRARVDGVCSNGHRIAAVGLSADGRCAQCRRETRRAYKNRRAVGDAVRAGG